MTQTSEAGLLENSEFLAVCVRTGVKNTENDSKCKHRDDKRHLDLELS